MWERPLVTERVGSGVN